MDLHPFTVRAPNGRKPKHLLKSLWELINKYKNHPITQISETLLPVITNEKLNLYLKEIADACGYRKISKDIDIPKGKLDLNSGFKKNKRKLIFIIWQNKRIGIYPPLKINKLHITFSNRALIRAPTTAVSALYTSNLFGFKQESIVTIKNISY